MMQQPEGRRRGAGSHPGQGVGQEEEDAQMSRDPFDTLPQGHGSSELMHRMRGGMMHRMPGGHDGPGPGDMADHEAHRRGGPGAGRGGLGMHMGGGGGMGMHMGGAMHMGPGRFPGGAGGGLGPMHGGPMGGHMMWYKDQQIVPRDGHEHPGPESSYYMGGEHGGMPADHPASNARLQQQVSYLLAENHNLRCVIRSMAKERDEYARKNDGPLPAPAALSCTTILIVCSA